SAKPKDPYANVAIVDDVVGAPPIVAADTPAPAAAAPDPAATAAPAPVTALAPETVDAAPDAAPSTPASSGLRLLSNSTASPAADEVALAASAVTSGAST